MAQPPRSKANKTRPDPGVQIRHGCDGARDWRQGRSRGDLHRRPAAADLATRPASPTCRGCRPGAISPLPAGRATPWPCGWPATIPRPIASARRWTRSPARPSMRWNRPASRRSAACACPAWSAISARCWKTGCSAPISPKSTTRPMRPIAEALGLLLREKLAGVPVPPSGHALVDLWRKEIEDKGGESLDKLLTRYENQDEFSKAAKMLLRDLNLVPESELDDPDSSDEEEGDDQEPDQGDSSDKAPEQGEGENDSQDSEQDEQAGESEETGDVEGIESDMADTDDDAAAEAGEDAPMPPPAKDGGDAPDQPVPVQGVHPEIRRDRQGSRTVPARRARPAACLARQAARKPGRRRGAPRQQAAAPADGQAEPLLAVRPRRGTARYGAPHPRRHRSDAGAELQGRERHRFPRYDRDAA